MSGTTVSYTPGGVAGLLSGSTSSTEANDKKLVSLFSTKPTAKPVKIKKTPKVPDEKETGTVDANSTKTKKKKRKYENELVLSRESIFEEGTPVTKKSKSDNSKKKPKKVNVKKDDPSKDERTIFVGNLCSETNKKSLMKLFRRFGTIETARIRSAISADLKVPQKVAVIKKELHPVKNTVNAYVVFAEKESAEKALKLNGKLVEGFHIRVDLSSKSSKMDPNRSVFIGNVPFDAQEEPVREYFSQCGAIENVRLVRDKKTGLGKGFGYVLFTDKSSVSLALQLANTDSTFKGRNLRVSRCNNEDKFGKKQKPNKGKKDKKNLKGKVKDILKSKKRIHDKSPKKFTGDKDKDKNTKVRSMDDSFSNSKDQIARKHSKKKKVPTATLR